MIVKGSYLQAHQLFGYEENNQFNKLQQSSINPSSNQLSQDRNRDNFEQEVKLDPKLLNLQQVLSENAQQPKEVYYKAKPKESQKVYQNTTEAEIEELFHNDHIILQSADNHHYINQVSSSKGIQKQYQFENFIHGQIQTTVSDTVKKSANQKTINNKMSASKTKKTSTYHHQRTKSDNIHSRLQPQIHGTSGQSSNKTSNTSQSKRQGVTAKNHHYVENEQPISKVKNVFNLVMGSEGNSMSRKIPNSANHSKKSSVTNSFAPHQQQPQNSITTTSSKKSTKEKYLELKAMYNDLLQKHYALASQQQHLVVQNQQQIGSHNKLPTQAQNMINFYPPNQQFLIQPSFEVKNNLQASATPRITMSNQLSSSALMSQMNQIPNEIPKDHVAKVGKTNQSKKADNLNFFEQNAQQMKASLKFQLVQGQSRKAGQSHKRSVSDGNEQCFKFKQPGMQKYLYPQPSNQTIQASQNSKNFDDETIVSQRVKHQYPQPSITTQIQNLVKPLEDIKNWKQPHGKQAPNNGVGENVPVEPPENQKPPQQDFNIKGFLIEMRNKNEKVSQTIENQQNSFKNSCGPRGEIAMIIEEHSPSHDHPQQISNRTVSSSKKNSQAESSYSKVGPNNKKGQEFNKVLQKYNKLKFEEKRASSPNIPKTDFMKNIKDLQSLAGHHKRVKSDVPENAGKQGSIKNSLNTIPLKSKMQKKSNYSNSSHIQKSIDKSTTPKKVQYSVFHQMRPSVFENKQNQGKKVVNVSIDLIREGDIDPLMLEESNIQGGHWIELEQNQNLKEVMMNKIKQIQHPEQIPKLTKPYKLVASQGQSGNSDKQRQEKYKKIAKKYVKQEEKAKNLPIAQPISKTESSQQSPMSKQRDLMYLKPGADKTPISGISPKPSPQFKHKDSVPAKKPITVIQQSQLNIPPSQAQLQLNLSQKKNFAPTNSVQQTTESFRSSQPTISQFLNQPTHLQRIDTLESNISEQNYSPRTKAIKKLIKHIRLSFKQTGAAPSTTVDFYRIGKVLGKGAFGKVNLALHKLTLKYAAVKSINKQYLSEEAQTKKVMQEVVILKKTRHKNVVRLYEFFETQKHILFVIELCGGGDLLNYVRKRRRLKEEVAKSIFKQIIEGLQYCHSKQILHRDIKLDNILLDSEGEVKICDFGVSKIVKKGEKMAEQCGTPAYIAPEILRDKGYEGFKVDIWSAGVVLYAMLYGTVPFKANNMSELQKLIVKAKYTLKDDISETARKLLYGLLEKDPNKRLNIPQILAHEWLKDVDETIQLFTEQEKEYIKSEFTYNDADRYNRNEGADPFTDHMLDSTQNSMFKNCSSKSVILAPFNSTKSDIENCVSLSNTVKELMQSKRCLKFAPRVRDVDKQYEINNNAELDNGVYHKADEEEEEKNATECKLKKELNSSDDSLQTSFAKETIQSDEDEEEKRIKQQKKEKKKKRKEQTELEKLESLIQQQEDQKDEEDGDEHPYGILTEEEQEKKILNTSGSDLRRSPRPQTGLQTAQTLIVDHAIVGQVEYYGYPRDFILKSLNNNDLNYCTTSYYLIQNPHALSLEDTAQKDSKANTQQQEQEKK